MNEHFPLISLVIPVYNTERFLEKCIKSAIAQDYPNLEILILNNGSTDGSQLIIDKYAALDKRIVTYKINHLATVKESKDNCYYRAKGEWITTLDSDDTIEPQFVSKLWKRQQTTKAKLVVAKMVRVDFDDNRISELPVRDFNYEKLMTGKEAMINTIKKWTFGMNGALIHRSLFNNIYIDNDNCLFYTDEVDSRCFLKESSLVAFSPAEYYHTYNPSSTGRKLSWNKYKYKLQTRRGLLKLVKKEAGTNSSEYGSLIWQSLGLSLMAWGFFVTNKSLVKDNEKEDFKRLDKALLDDICLVRWRLSTLVYAPLLLIVRVLVRLLKD